LARRLFSAPRGLRHIVADYSKVPPYEEITLAHRNRRIRAYGWRLDTGRPRVLLAHGWAGHGLQFAAMVEPLLEAGYEVVSFDQPAHGASSGDAVTLPEFARIVRHVAETLGPFHAVIGHSLGGAATAFALSRGLAAKRAVLIAAPANAEQEIQRFARFLHIPEAVRAQMQRAIETEEGVRMAQLHASAVALRIDTPALLVHDQLDREVSPDNALEYAAGWRGARVLSTRGLGYVRILRDAGVIAEVIRFIGIGRN
jgi:pimeloyl-ACP methyl ester carboxylesterase